jgi:glutathione S-transferase
MGSIILRTIPISHYGERARWALDVAGVDYLELHHLQMFSWGSAKWARGSRTLPVVTIGRRVLADSADVVRWSADELGAPLYPRGIDRREAERLERRFAEAFGVATRLIAYDWFFRSLDLCLPYNAGRAPELEVLAMSALRRGVKPFAAGYLGVRPQAVAEARDLVDRTLDDVASRLGDGRPHLLGEAFSAADLAFATMMAPAVLPARYPVTLPTPDLIPDDACARVKAIREHPAGRFALRLYQARPPTRGRYLRALRVPGVPAAA